MTGKRTTRRIGEILPGVFKNLGLEVKMEEVRLHREWGEIVGEAVAGRSRPGAVRDGVLMIVVENNVWMHEIRFHRKEIINRIGQKFPKLAVNEIRLELGRERGEE